MRQFSSPLNKSAVWDKRQLRDKRQFNKGGPEGNKFAESHGIVTWRNEMKRRAKKGQSVIDMRSTAGKHATAMRNDLIKERGGPDNLSVVQLTLIELIARDVYFVDEIDSRICMVMRKLAETEKKNSQLQNGKLKNPKAVGILYGYRAPIVRNLTSNLMALGLEKPPPKVKSLDEILSEDESEP